MIGHHVCTDDDWGLFAPPSDNAYSKFKRISKGTNMNYYCLDWDKECDDFNIGYSNQGAFKRLDF